MFRLDLCVDVNFWIDERGRTKNGAGSQTLHSGQAWVWAAFLKEDRDSVSATGYTLKTRPI